MTGAVSSSILEYSLLIQMTHDCLTYTDWSITVDEWTDPDTTAEQKWNLYPGSGYFIGNQACYYSQGHGTGGDAAEFQYY